GPDFGNCSRYGIADTNYEFDELYDDPNDLYPLILVDSNIVTLPVQQQSDWKWAGSVFPMSEPQRTRPYKPRMDVPYILDISLHNTAGNLADGPDGEVYYGGVKQVEVQPGAWIEWLPDEPEYNLYGWINIGGWDLEENIEEEPCSPPSPIYPDEVNEFKPIFKNSWNWIEIGDWKGAVGSIILSIPKRSGPICSFILAVYKGNKAVPSMTYTFEHMEETAGASDIIIFSKDVTVDVPLSKQGDLRSSVRMEILSIALSLAAKACSGTIAAPAAPGLYAASICCTITSMVLYDSAADPLEDCTQIVKPIDVPVPQEIDALEEGAVKKLALAAIDLASLEHAYAESYIRYDSARIFDSNEPNESYMGMQLGSAVRYNAMAAQKLQYMQRLLAVIDADPDIPKPTYSTIMKFHEDIDVNGLPPVQDEILEVFDLSDPPDPNDPNASDVRDVMLGLTDPLEPYLVNLWLTIDSLHNHLYKLIRGRYIAEHAMEIAAEAEQLEPWIYSHFAENVGIKNIWADITEISRANMLNISVELDNYGHETEIVDVNVYAGTNDEPNLFMIQNQQIILPAGYSTVYNFDWDMSEINTPGTHVYRLKAEAIVYDTNDTFKADNTLTGQSIIVMVSADITAPGAPSLDEITVYDDTTATLSWTEFSGDPNGYNKIYRDDSVIWSGWTSPTTYTDTGLSPSTLYSYTVTAYDAAGNESEKSNIRTVTTSPPP
ncbi:MAG: fibronectin type III domain-containing protein, partial [Planctomycetota bacterium]